MLLPVSQFLQSTIFEFRDFIKAMNALDSLVCSDTIIQHAIKLLQSEGDPDVVVLGTLVVCRERTQCSTTAVLSQYIEKISNDIFSMPLSGILQVSCSPDPILDEKRRILLAFLKVTQCYQSLRINKCLLS